MDEGWICLHRSIMNTELWLERPFDKARAWVDLILMMNHSPQKTLLGNQTFLVERGSRITSELKLSIRWGWSRHKTSNFLKFLESEQMIELKKDNKKTSITVVNYCKYQDKSDNYGTAKGQQKDISGTAKGQQKDTNNNGNNETMFNNGTNKHKGKKFVKPTIEEIGTYCQERNNTVNPAQFYDHYESNGWMVGKGNHMKDWKSTVRNWEHYQEQRRAENRFKPSNSKQDAIKTVNELYKELGAK